MNLTSSEISMYRPSRVVFAAAQPQGLVGGFEAEVSDAMARKVGLRHDPNRPFLPVQVLARTAGMWKRDLAVGTASVGGNLVGTDVPEISDALQTWSVAARLGVRMIEADGPMASFPRVTASASTNSLANEQGTATESTPTFAATAVSPKQLGGYVEIARQLMKMAPRLADAFASSHLLRVTGLAIDTAILAGAGTGGQPTGIVNTVGVGSQGGSSLSWSGLANMKELCATANADDDAIRFVARPAVRELLETRERVTNTGLYLWQGDRVVDRPGLVSMAMPASTLLAGDFSQCWVPIWGGAVQIEVNPYAQFQSGVIGLRALAWMDVAVVQPAAFSVATSIT